MLNNNKEYLQITLASGNTYTVELIERRGNVFVTAVPKSGGKEVAMMPSERVHTIIDNGKEKQALMLSFNWVEKRPVVGAVAVFKTAEKINREKARKGVRRKTAIRAKANMIENKNEVASYDVEISDMSVTGCQLVKINQDWNSDYIGKELVLVIPTELSFIEFPCKIVRLVESDGQIRAGCKFAFK